VRIVLFLANWVDDPLVAIGRALANPVRLELLRVLGEEGLTLSQAAELVQVARSTAHFHYSVLLQAGLVMKKGRRRGCRYHWPTNRMFIGFRPGKASP
jgi:DNA-binding transcriptional ArsR family regulator